MDDRPVEIAQDSSGRWRWSLGEGSSAGGREAGHVAFRTREDAATDFALHARGLKDATGRLVMPKDHLRKMISAIALPCAACADVYFGGVYWIRRDAGGCNWGVAIMNGAGDYEGCLECVEAGREELRRRYAIVDEA